MGYLFLVNVIIILIQADAVIAIFYDVVALQFVQMLDDIGFRVAKMEVLGQRLRQATITPYFHVDLRGGAGDLNRKWRPAIVLKAAYLINLVVFLSAMIVVSVRQTRGYYQCESITVQCKFRVPLFARKIFLSML